MAQSHKVESATSLLDLIGKTPLVELPRLSPKPDVRIYAKLEAQNPTGSIKDRVAKAMLDDAGLEPGARLLEPTSGNTGISLALIAKLRGYDLTCVLPESATDERKRLLRLYGAELVFSPAVAAAEPLPGEDVIGLRSLEDGYVPPVLDVSKLDRKLLVSNAESVAGLRALLDEEGIFAGVSSGAVVHVARKLASELDEGVVVCILADGGWRYLSAPFWDAKDVERSMERTIWW